MCKYERFETDSILRTVIKLPSELILNNLDLINIV
jgi:hypothetical protein